MMTTQVNDLKKKKKKKVCDRDVIKDAPKVMPPIYFHGNYNRHKENCDTI